MHQHDVKVWPQQAVLRVAAPAARRLCKLLMSARLLPTMQRKRLPDRRRPVQSRFYQHRPELARAPLHRPVQRLGWTLMGCSGETAGQSCPTGIWCKTWPYPAVLGMRRRTAPCPAQPACQAGGAAKQGPHAGCAFNSASPSFSHHPILACTSAFTQFTCKFRRCRGWGWHRKPCERLARWMDPRIFGRGCRGWPGRLIMPPSLVLLCEGCASHAA